MKNYLSKILLIILFISSLSFSQTETKIEYILSMSNPHTHYFEVVMKVTDYDKDVIDFLMPVWAPGSYLIREFAKNVSFFKADDNQNNPLLFEKINK